MEKKSKKIFAIVGMCGSGKTEVVKYLQSTFDWTNVYLPEVLFDEIKRQDLELNWENEECMRIGLRKKHGIGVFAELSLPKIEKALGESDAVIAESLYSWSEYKIIKEKYPEIFKVIAIYASPEMRFRRLQERKVRPMKSQKEFLDRDTSEIEEIEKGGPISVANHTVINHGNLKKLYREIDKIMEEEGMVKKSK